MSPPEGSGLGFLSNITFVVMTVSGIGTESYRHYDR